MNESVDLETASHHGYTTPTPTPAIGYRGPIDAEQERRVLRCCVLLCEIVGVLLVIVIGIWAGVLHGSTLLTQFPAFNYHPLFMAIGMVFLLGQGLLSFRLLSGCISGRSCKYVHFLCMFLSLVFAIVAVVCVSVTRVAVFDNLHAWIGAFTLLLFSAQLLIGFVSKCFPSCSGAVRDWYNPIHELLGVFIFLLACVCALTGIAIESESVLTVEGVFCAVFAFAVILYALLVVYLVVSNRFKALGLIQPNHKAHRQSLLASSDHKRAYDALDDRPAAPGSPKKETKSWFSGLFSSDPKNKDQDRQALREPHDQNKQPNEPADQEKKPGFFDGLFDFGGTKKPKTPQEKDSHKPKESPLDKEKRKWLKDKHLKTDDPKSSSDDPYTTDEAPDKADYKPKERRPRPTPFGQHKFEVHAGEQLKGSPLNETPQKNNRDPSPDKHKSRHDPAEKKSSPKSDRKKETPEDTGPPPPEVPLKLDLNDLESNFNPNEDRKSLKSPTKSQKSPKKPERTFLDWVAD